MSDERRQLLIHNEPGRQKAARDQQQRGPGPPDPVIDILLPLLDGSPVSVDGSTLSAHIGLSAPRAGRVPVLLAAMAPRMLDLAGEQTDGTVLWMTGPATVRDYVVPAISAAARAAGRR